ncbi:probable proline--tRNA ligase, mitochondrial [Haliotis cracherodii]|uniref:probable proline--tRNA ligase, mitochondrial n=1 Tax=Haliotis cracherodii TaxID=6455 RepID=UPI0039ED0E3F
MAHLSRELILCKMISSASSIRQTRRCLHNRRYVTKMFQNFGKVQPAVTEFTCSSQKLMLYNEVIQSCHSGSYHMLPLGLRALEKLIKIIDQEMQVIGGQKIAMPTLATAVVWKKSGRWKEAGAELFKLKDRHSIEYCLGPTHEEVVTGLFSSVSPVSYRRLPLLLYQITRKFRDEMAPKYGLLRGREFEMKDMYTFDSTEECARETYSSVCQAYCKIFDRLGVKYVKAAGDTGNIGGTMSHEFHLPAEVGEDTLLVCDRCGFSSNIELLENDAKSDFKKFCPNKENDCDMKKSHGIEVGHAFLLGTKYSSVFGANCQTETGQVEPAQMGCYGLGVTRILQGCVEVLSSSKQIHWPGLVAPYQVCIIPQKEGYEADTLFRLANDLSDQLTSMANLSGEVVIDDRTQMTIGKRLYEARRLGYPYIVVIGRKALEAEPQYEVIHTQDAEPVFLSRDQLQHRLASVDTVSLS